MVIPYLQYECTKPRLTGPAGFFYFPCAVPHFLNFVCIMQTSPNLSWSARISPQQLADFETLEQQMRRQLQAAQHVENRLRKEQHTLQEKLCDITNKLMDDTVIT